MISHPPVALFKACHGVLDRGHEIGQVNATGFAVYCHNRRFIQQIGPLCSGEARASHW